MLKLRSLAEILSAVKLQTKGVVDMIFTLIVFIILVVFLAFFFGRNLSNLCTFWFFKTYTDLPIAVLVLIAFGVGIVFSLLLVVFVKLRSSSKNKSEKKSDEVKA